MMQRWALLVTAVGAFGALLIGMLVNDPVAPSHALNLQPVFYPEPTPHPGYHLSKERIGERDVSAYVLTRDDIDGKPRPAVILVHGGGITDLLEYAKPQYKGEWFIPRYDYIPYRLAEAGFLVIAIDNWWAGERYKPEYAELAREAPIRNIFRAWVRARHDVSSVIDVVAARDDVDPTRIGVAGWSGGGITALMAITHDPRVATIVAWKAGPDYITKIQKRGQMYLAEDEMDSDGAFIAELKRNDPIFHIENIPPRPLALIGNREDPAMPRELAEQFVEQLKPFYQSSPERLRLSLYNTPKPTHDLAREPLEEGCQWLIEWLGPTNQN